FRPEFLNRLDEIVLYKPLSRENIRGIVELQIEDLRRRLASKQLRLSMTDAAKDHVIEAAYDPLFGARPLKRYLQSKVETLVARKLIREDVAPGTELCVDMEGGELTVK
ncbi:MAG: type VI secretion system ATPase TssH, partial [Clostridia bacterium]|nr:type VI secretion system ATPase TssH [Clostridia bacterium]